MPDFQAQVSTLKGRDEVAVCHLKGAIDTSTLLSFQSTLFRLRRQGIRRLVLDMEEISYVNSTGFSVLLKHAELFKNGAGELVVARMHPKVQLVFEVLGLQPYIRVFLNLEDAASSLLACTEGDAVSSAPPEGAKRQS